MFEDFPQHRDRDASLATTRSTETNRAERISEREEFENTSAKDFRTQPSLDAVASTRTFARYASTGEPVTLTPEEWLRHIYLVGKTGSGKSYSMKSIALALIEASETVIYIDPHGDDFRELKDAIPPGRRSKTDLLDVTDTKFPFSFNPLRGVSYEQIPVVAGMQAEGIRDIWADAYSERMHSLVYNGLATLMEHPLTTLDDLPLLFYRFKKDAPKSTRKRQARLREVQNPVTRRFWDYEFPTYPADAPVAILSRIGQLLASPHAAAILKHETSAFTLSDAIDKNHVVLINLSKGVIGNTPASILGSFIISEIRRVAMARAAIPIAQRRSFYLFIDEFQSFATLSLAQILSEARKYKLGVVLAHQFTDQLQDEVLAAVKGNCGTLISFRVGDDDADALIGEFSPFPNASLTDQQIGHAFLKQGIQAHPIIIEPYKATYSGSTATVETYSRRRNSRA